MEYEQIIKQKSFRPVRSLSVSLPNFTYCVGFEDGVVIRRKDELGLRMFLIMIRNLKYRIIPSDETEHCISSPVGYWDLLGFRAGDAILFQNREDLPILFS